MSHRFYAVFALLFDESALSLAAASEWRSVARPTARSAKVLKNKVSAGPLKKTGVLF